MNMRPNHKVTSDRQRAAAEWLVRLQETDISDEDLAEWGAWIDASPLNKRVFDDAERLSRRTDSVRGELLDIAIPTDIERQSDEYDGSVPISDWLAEQNAGKGRKGGDAGRFNRLRGFALAAGFGIAAVGLGYLLSTDILVSQQQKQILVYETGSSEHRLVALADGSSIGIGAKSAVSVNLTRDQRVVVLEQGEALFTVAKDPDRPFVVVAGSGTITAIGTVFNVRRDDGRVVVTVTEGLVEVEQPPFETLEEIHTSASENKNVDASSARLSEGQQGILSSEGINIVAVADPSTATTWLGGRHQFRAEPLEFVVNVVNRYSSEEIIIADRAVAALPYTGSVFQNQIDQWLPGLEAAFPIEVNRVGANKVIITRKDAH